jgi:hypothetical protein
VPSEIRSSSDLAVDAQDAEGVLTSDRITETDILDGRWDNAQVEVFRVNWQDVAQRVLPCAIGMAGGQPQNNTARKKERY